MHIGIIPDGNRRWAKQNNKSFEQLLSHWFDEMFVTHIVKFLSSDYTPPPELIQITELSLYVLSTKNLERDDDTLKTINRLLTKMYEHLNSNKQALALAKDVKLNAIGRLNLLPISLQVLITKLQNEIFTTVTKPKFTINLAIAYDPIDDMRRLTNPKTSQRSYQTDIDLVIRTGGEQRSSGFFPYHTLYSEWFYLTKYFPDFTIQDLTTIIKSFQKRERRFGK